MHDNLRREAWPLVVEIPQPERFEPEALALALAYWNRRLLEGRSRDWT